MAKKLETKRLAIFDDRDTAIVDSGASGWYFTPDAPVSNVNPHAAKICVGTATDQPQFSSASCELPFDGMPPDLFGHIMPAFRHNLLGIGILCDKDCKVLFTKQTVIIYDKNNEPFLTGWRETDRAKISRISFGPDPSDLLPCSDDPTNEPEETTLAAFSAYDLPSIEALDKYFHAAAGYPARSTCLTAIKAGNYVSWPG